MRPQEVKLHKVSATLELVYADGLNFSLPSEYLRVYSPSAEVRGHGQGQELLQIGKRRVKLNTVEPVGHYAVRLRFDDGHDTGIYTWEYLYELGSRQEFLWQDYLNRLESVGASREDPAVQVVNIVSLKK
jgi:DUF971 family protein